MARRLSMSFHKWCTCGGCQFDKNNIIAENYIKSYRHRPCFCQLPFDLGAIFENYRRGRSERSFMGDPHCWMSDLAISWSVDVASSSVPKVVISPRTLSFFPSLQCLPSLLLVPVPLMPAVHLLQNLLDNNSPRSLLLFLFFFFY